MTNEDLKYIVPAIITGIIAVISLIWNIFHQKSIEKLKSKTSKEALVHKLQFEKEFKLNEGLWSYINELRPKLITPLSPSEQANAYEIPEPDLFEISIEQRIRLLNGMKGLFEKNEPYFYPEIRNIVYKIISILVKEPLSTSKELTEGYNRIAVLIEERNNSKTS